MLAAAAAAAAELVEVEDLLQLPPSIRSHERCLAPTPHRGGITPCPHRQADLQGVLLAGAHARILPCLTGDPEQELTLLLYQGSALFSSQKGLHLQVLTIQIACKDLQPTIFPFSISVQLNDSLGALTCFKCLCLWSCLEPGAQFSMFNSYASSPNRRVARKQIS